MSYLDIVFDGPPGPEAGRFVEVEDEAGASVRFGEWVEREDGYRVLRIPDLTAENDALKAWVADVRWLPGGGTCARTGRSGGNVGSTQARTLSSEWSTCRFATLATPGMERSGFLGPSRVHSTAVFQYGHRPQKTQARAPKSCSAEGQGGN